MDRRRCGSACVLAVVFAASITAASFADAPATRPAALAERFVAARKASEDADRKLVEASKASPDRSTWDAKLTAISDDRDRKHDAVGAIAKEIQRTDPSSPAGFEALAWIVREEPQSFFSSAGALAQLTKHHAANPAIAQTIAIAAYYNPSTGMPSFRRTTELANAVRVQNKDRNALAQAAYGLAMQAKFRCDDAERSASDKYNDLFTVAQLAFEQLNKEYGDVADVHSLGEQSGLTLGHVAAMNLFELRSLHPGKPAPATEGEDLNGKPMKLSDYRGKAVMLVFWASWCGPCMAAIPHERELAKRYAGRPFALVGVNGDGDRPAARQTVVNAEISWRSFWNGPENGRGPIVSMWNVHAWPAVYLIDAGGVIRHRWLFRQRDIDRAVEQLVTDAERPQHPPSTQP